ncbi:MAG: hypothetical protein HYY49_13105, partial [Ignavibacteriales bacterium]|nr:hypothetical protein [Ignavibacteriales bacterium]
CPEFAYDAKDDFGVWPFSEKNKAHVLKAFKGGGRGWQSPQFEQEFRYCRAFEIQAAEQGKHSWSIGTSGYAVMFGEMKLRQEFVDEVPTHDSL